MSIMILSKNEVDFLKIQNLNFTSQDAETLIENAKIINKFIWVVQAWYRTELALWSARWKEEQIYNYVECLEDLKLQIDSLWDKLKKYRENELKNLQNTKKN